MLNLLALEELDADEGKPDAKHVDDHRQGRADSDNRHGRSLRAESGTVEQKGKRVRRIVRRAIKTRQRIDLFEDIDRPDQGQHGDDHERRNDKRNLDLPENPPGSGPFQIRTFDAVDRNVVKGRKEDQRRESNPPPNIHDDQGWRGGCRITQPGVVKMLDVELLEQGEKQSELRIVVQLPKEPDRDDGEKDRHEEEPLVQVVAADVAAEQISEEDAYRVLDQHGHDKPRKVVFQRIGKLLVVWIDTKNIDEVLESHKSLADKPVPGKEAVEHGCEQRSDDEHHHDYRRRRQEQHEPRNLGSFQHGGQPQ